MGKATDHVHPLTCIDELARPKAITFVDGDPDDRPDRLEENLRSLSLLEKDALSADEEAVCRGERKDVASEEIQILFASGTERRPVEPVP